MCVYLTVEREREIKELKERVHQLEKEKTSAQRQTRLALARAVRAEIKTDKIPVLEQKLSQTKTNLEEQIQMKDEARIAAEQQLQQTKATLEHEIQMAERQFNQEKAGLQHEIQERDQKILSLQQQIHQTEKFLKHHKEAAMSAQQQFSHRVKNLEHQIEVTEEARVTLEMQIQAKDREKAELEHQLHQKEEQIQAKDKEKVELEQQLCWKEEQIRSKEREKAELEQQLRWREEHGPPKVTQAAEMQQEGSGHVIAQGAVPSVHQLLQAREEVRTKEEELSKMREEHEAELSRLTYESTAKQQEIELELKAQILQADALQRDRDDLQQQLTAKDIQITAISSELQHNQDRIEALTDKNREMTAQINSLENKFTKAEFLEGVFSQEVDQLREELMGKEVEIDYLRKEQAYTTPTTTATSSPLCT